MQRVLARLQSAKRNVSTAAQWPGRFCAVLITARKNEIVAREAYSCLRLTHIAVPASVIEIAIAVGDLGASQPVDRPTRTGGRSIIPGIHRAGRAEDLELVAATVGDGTVARLGAGLHECVVGVDIGRGRIAPCRGDEQQTETVAGGKTGGLQGPVMGNLVGAIASTFHLGLCPGGEHCQQRQADQCSGGGPAQGVGGSMGTRNSSGGRKTEAVGG